MLERGTIIKEILNTLCLAGFIIVSLVSFNENTSHLGFYTLVPVMGASFFYFHADKDTIRIFLCNKLMVGIGLISFSIYLWHFNFCVF